MKSSYRNVQQIGKKGSFIITLPKSWCEKYQIGKGTELEILIDQVNEASLLISLPSKELNTKQQVNLPFSPLFEEKTLSRAILQRYLDGFEIIRILDISQSGERISDVRNQIFQLVHKLFGAWIESYLDHIEIHISTHMISPHNTLQNLFEMANSMIIKSVDAYIANDVELAIDVEKMDDEVDKLYFHIVRTVKTLLRNPIAATKSLVSDDFSLLESLDLRMIASYLENLADSAETIALYVKSQDAAPTNSKALLERLSNLTSEISKILERSYRFFKNSEYRKAVETIPIARELFPRIEKLRSQNIPIVVIRTLEEAVECIIDICDLVGE